ncbi:hypothetical protein [Marinimicrobium sp. ABcell2]|uniref:hypothetical protein n=1 Tax=Marinimicrobium sp. ABcell2 TaxID=3069751 RepID=UPI0027AE9501|nr:hypothetical protein [Marinimicrobium sp. ABcell2]MDQ2077476.1 hypothetical protein [Marinimicrobium sp. ABcell2]
MNEKEYLLFMAFGPPLLSVDTVIFIFRWAYSGGPLKVKKTESKIISPDLIEANKKARKRLSGSPEKGVMSC